MPKEKVGFVATQYKNQNMEVHFYTRDGERVDFDEVKRAPTKERVEFYIEKEERGKRQKINV